VPNDKRANLKRTLIESRTTLQVLSAPSNCNTQAQSDTKVFAQCAYLPGRPPEPAPIAPDRARPR
jgi:hypothetical protein